MSKPVLVFDTTTEEATAYTSVTKAARALDRDPSTISRAASGDRDVVSTCDDLIVTYLEFAE